MSTHHTLAELESLWPPLERAGGVKSPFQSLPWLRHWSLHRGQHLEPFSLVVDDGATVAPLGRARIGGVRVVQLLGSGDSDFADLVSTRKPAEAWESVARELARQRDSWDLLHLHSVLERDAIMPALQTHLGSSGFERVYDSCPFIEIRGSWNDFIGPRKNLRKQVKRSARRLEEMGPVTVEAVPAPLSEALLQEFVRVEQASWKWKLGNPVYAPGSQKDFLFAVLQDPAMPVRAWLLRVGGVLAAVCLVLEQNWRWCCYLSAYRQDYKHSGSLLMAKIVEAAHSSQVDVVSLLRGDHGYKKVWADASEPVYEIAYPSNLRGGAAALVLRLRWKAASSPTLRKLRSLVLSVGDRREQD